MGESRRLALLIVSIAVLAACARSAPPAALGTVEWDHVTLIAEAAEPVLEIAVRENDRVETGALLLRLDDRRARAELAQASAELARLIAVLDELRNGARPEAIAESRARWSRAQSLANSAQQDLARVTDLRARRLSTPSELDHAQASARAATAEQRAAAAALEQLVAGTRIEVLTQAESGVAAAQARRDALAISLDRLTVHAPRAGRIDSIAIEVGDQPARGAALVTLLVGDTPHVRVFVPAAMRAGLTTGARFAVRVEGIETPLRGQLRYVRSEPSFTPYYALSGDDASRLAYAAEIVLEGDAAAVLPAGLPAQAVPEQP